MTPPDTPKKLKEAPPDQIRTIEHEITWLEEIISAQSLNGLFERKRVQDATISAQECYGYVGNARQHLRSKTVYYKDYSLAREELNKCWTRIDQAIERGGRTYKILYVQAIDVILFLLLFVVGAVVLPFFYCLPIAFGLFPAWVPAAGAVGSSLRYLWRLKSSVDNRTYCKSWRPGAVITPFVGGIMALGVYSAYYVTVRATIVALDIPGFIVCFVSGYGWAESIDLLDRFAKATLGSILSKVK